MRIAINGTGIAGPTLAYWLRFYGHEPVLFERAPALRTGGYVIDFWGLGYEIAERMGLMPELKRRGYRVKCLRMVGERGRAFATIDLNRMTEQIGGRIISLPRGDLASALFEACAGVAVHFGVSIDGIEQHPKGLDVTLSDGRTECFDLVVGADGLHSRVRELAFGPEQQFERSLGCHVAALCLVGYPKRDELAYVGHAGIARQVARMSLRADRTLLLFTWRSALLPGEPAPGEEVAALRAIFGEMRWEVPDLLARLDDVDEIYLDRVSQIRMPEWTRGRVALVGDAAACVSLLAGEGTGLAMVEAYVLAGELQRAAGNPLRAFECYQSRLRPFLAAKQDAALGMLNFFAPKNRWALWVRNLGVRLVAIPLVSSRFVEGSLRDDLELPRYE